MGRGYSCPLRKLRVLGRRRVVDIHKVQGVAVHVAFQLPLCGERLRAGWTRQLDGALFRVVPLHLRNILQALTTSPLTQNRVEDWVAEKGQ